MTNIELTEHVCLRYIERFNPNLNAVKDVKLRMERAKAGIMSILENARYVSDNSEGILLHSQVHKCNLIIRNRKLITLYIPDDKTRLRESKHLQSQFRKVSNA